MTHNFEKIATLTLLSLAVAAQPAGQQSRPQENPPASNQAEQAGQKPPHVDPETNPQGREPEQAIEADLQQDPHMAYSRVTVLATDQEIVLSGTVLTGTAKRNAEDIARKHANGRKVTNRIKVNPSTHPGVGL